MIEGEIAPIDEELQSLAHLVTRQHAIVLCCAHSVAELVEEVARNLGGLGFDVDVVCGAEARSALLGRYDDRRDVPTIYVVCVQGTLKEQVLKPLRQALATHGGPNQHLFVAVLDLALPLAMVGQIRRFAEALERPAGKGGALNERRQWRENLGPGGSDRMPTRAYRAVDVLERTGAHAVVGATAVTRTGPQAVIGSGRPAKLGSTTKYRAVTGQLPTVSGDDDASPETSSSRRRRKTHAPKVRVKPVAQTTRTRRGSARSEPVPAEPVTELEPVLLEPEPTGTPPGGLGDDDEGLREHVPPADIEATMVASWGSDDVDTKVRPNPNDTQVAAVPTRSGDTVPPPLPPRRETVLYVETDEAVLLPAPRDVAMPNTSAPRSDTVIGQPPTRFRATPVLRGDTQVGPAPTAPESSSAMPRRETMVGSPAQTIARPPTGSNPTARGETVFAPPPRAAPEGATSRGETVIALPPSAAPQSATARGETVVAPAPSDPGARGRTVVPAADEVSETETTREHDFALRSDGGTPTSRGETVVAPSRTLVPDTPTSRGETVVAPGRTLVPDTATSRGETVVAPTRSAAPESATARGETVLLTPDSTSTATARGETVLLPLHEATTEAEPAAAEPAREPTGSRARVRVVPALVDDEAVAEPPSEPQRRPRWPLALGTVAIAGAVAIAWSTGMLGGARPVATPAAATDTELAKAELPAPTRVEPAHAAVDPAASRIDTPAPSEPAEPSTAVPTPAPAEPALVEPAPVEAVSPTPVEPAPTAPTTAEPTPVAPTPVEPAPEATDDPPALSPRGEPEPIEPGLATAVAQRRIRLTDTLYVSTLRSSESEWLAARTLCESLDIDGVTGFRLPYRRELQAIDIARYLRDMPHWSRTVPDRDRESAYLLDPTTGVLTLTAKDETAAVVCVRPR